MRKDSIQQEAIEKALSLFAERGLHIEDYSEEPTDYFRGTVMEPSHVSTLKASFKEYEDLGKKHEDITNRIKDINEKMKISRQRGAFQVLQDQMKTVKDLVKEREGIDARMATIDLARKKEDDRRLAEGQEVSYSEKIRSVGDRIAQLEEMMASYQDAPN